MLVDVPHPPTDSIPLHLWEAPKGSVSNLGLLGSCPFEVIYNPDDHTVTLAFEEPCYVNASTLLASMINHRNGAGTVTSENPLVAANRTLRDPVTSPLNNPDTDQGSWLLDEQTQAEMLFLGPDDMTGDNRVGLTFPEDTADPTSFIVMVTQPDGTHQFISISPAVVDDYVATNSMRPVGYEEKSSSHNQIYKLWHLISELSLAAKCATSLGTALFTYSLLLMYNSGSIKGLYEQVKDRTKVTLEPKHIPSDTQLDQIVKMLALELNLTPDKLQDAWKDGKWYPSLVTLKMSQLSLGKQLLRLAIPLNIEYIIRYVLNRRILDTLVDIRRINKEGYIDSTNSFSNPTLFLPKR